MEGEVRSSGHLSSSPPARYQSFIRWISLSTRHILLRFDRKVLWTPLS